MNNTYGHQAHPHGYVFLCNTYRRNYLEYWWCCSILFYEWQTFSTCARPVVDSSSSFFLFYSVLLFVLLTTQNNFMASNQKSMLHKTHTHMVMYAILLRFLFWFDFTISENCKNIDTIDFIWIFILISLLNLFRVRFRICLCPMRTRIRQAAFVGGQKRETSKTL